MYGCEGETWNNEFYEAAVCTGQPPSDGAVDSGHQLIELAESDPGHQLQLRREEGTCSIIV